MNTPTVSYATSTNTQIVLLWTALTGNSAGGSSVTITNYFLEWDQGTNTWVSLTTINALTFTKTGLTGGTTYQFRITAINAYGSGTTSSILSVIAAQAPATPSAPTVAVSGIYVSISWTAPASNFATIDAYRVLIITSTSTFIESTTYCDGSLSATITSLACLVPMNAFWSSPFSLVQNTLIQAEV